MLGPKEVGLTQSSYFPRRTRLEDWYDLSGLSEAELEQEKEDYVERLRYALKVGADVVTRHSGGKEYPNSARDDLYQYCQQEPELEKELDAAIQTAALKDEVAAGKALIQYLEKATEAYANNVVENVLANKESGYRTQILL